VNPQKLLQKALASPNNFRFAEARALAEAFGFRLARTSGSHHIFVHPGISQLLNLQEAGAEVDTVAARQLVSDRERDVKGPKKARLHDASALALWNGAAGMGQMDYRWGRIERIVLDILAAVPRA
jgi:hypothetical protein